MHFPVIETPRLRIRPPVMDDVDVFHARRNHPDVARYQNWELPYPLDKALGVVAGDIADRDEADGWNMLVVTDRATGETLGDLAIGMTFQGRCAEIGYSFHPDHWGKGFAIEASAALVEHLFEEVGVSRISGMLHPDNPASARVLERVGLIFEGHTRLSFWVGDDNSDDHIYGMTRSQWEEWRSRPTQPPDQVTLIEIGPENADAVAQLRTHKTQEHLVAPMAESFRDALFPEVVSGAPVEPWMRAIDADGQLVGFVMLAAPTRTHTEPYLWRLLIDRLHQRRGIGTMVLEALEPQCSTWGADTLAVSWATGPGSPERFYMRNGFVPTGRVIDGEVEARKYFE